MKDPATEPADRSSAQAFDAEAFRRAGHVLVDALSDFYESLPGRRVTPGETTAGIRRLLPRQPLPLRGCSGADLLGDITPLLFEHSLHNGHPRFFGYITSSASPLGALADLLAAGVNANCGLRDLSPLANEIELQTVAWLAELIGYPAECGGIMVSGGNVANMLGFLAARRAGLDWDVRANGLVDGERRPRVYASKETHTWIQKAADVSGLGTRAIHWIETDSEQRMDPRALEAAIAADRARGELPFLVVGTAGNVSTGAVDALEELAAIAGSEQLWLHVDGAYGAPAACLPEAGDSLRALALADSVALDPHKWLYAPIEAACTLTRDPAALRETFSFRPPYYRLDDGDEAGLDYFEHGLQNTRGFRALKVWLGLRATGRQGYEQRIRTDIAHAERLFERAAEEPELEAGTNHLSITTFRYRPPADSDSATDANYVDELNRRLLVALQTGGEAYVSNAIIGGRYFLRACIVNFRTTPSDIDALVDIVLREGRVIDAELRDERTQSR